MAREEPEPEGDDNTVRISMLLEKQLLDGVDSASGRYGLSRSVFIRQALEKALRDVSEEPDWNYLIESTKSPFYYDLGGVAKRLRHTGYITPKGLRIIQQKIHDLVGPAELLQALTSPYEQLLRKLGLTRKQVDEAIRKESSISLRTDSG